MGDVALAAFSRNLGILGFVLMALPLENQEQGRLPRIGGFCGRTIRRIGRRSAGGGGRGAD